MYRFSLEAWVKTDKRSGLKMNITPQRFKKGDKVLRLNPHTRKPYEGRPDLVVDVIWYAETWFYVVKPIVGQLITTDNRKMPIVTDEGSVLVNEEFLVKA